MEHIVEDSNDLETDGESDILKFTQRTILMGCTVMTLEQS